MIESGDGDWIINSYATETDSGVRFLAVGLQEKDVLIPKKAFYLAASHRQIKTTILCVLCASAVRFLFWTRMILA